MLFFFSSPPVSHLCRYISTGVCVLFSMDMLGRSILYGKHNAFVYNIDRSISVAALSDAIRQKQDTETSDGENYLRVVAIDCDEFAFEFDVFEGN